MFEIILIIFLATVIGYLLNNFYQWRCKANLINKIPGPKAYPVVGNILEFRNVKLQGKYLASKDMNYLKYYGKLFDAHGPIIRIWLSIVPIVSLSKAEYMEPILSSRKNISKSKSYKFAESLFGDGLYLSNGSEWTAKRKLLDPAFHYTILESFVPVMIDHCKVFINRLECKMNGCDFNIVPFVNDLTLDITFHLMVGVDLKLQENRQPEFIESIDNTIRLLANRMTKPWLWNNYIYSLSKYYEEETKCFEIFRKVSREAIEKQLLERKLNQTNKSDEFGSKIKIRFYDILINAFEKAELDVTLDNISAEVDSFLVAGSEPTTMAISTTIFLLATHPYIQEKVAQELYSIFGDSDRPLTYVDLSSMKYLQRVIEESLRLYPPAPIIQRELTDEVIIDNKFILPAGTTVEFNIYQLHRDPSVYPNPEQFNPDNFLLENCQKRHPYSYMPFSAGPRNCIGQKLSMLLMKTVLAALLRKFELYSSKMTGIPDIIFKGALQPRNGFYVQLKPHI